MKRTVEDNYLSSNIQWTSKFKK